VIASMTAFSSQTAFLPQGRITWELRAVNHRFMELSLRLPEELRPLEGVLRERISRQVKRGKVDAQLRLEHDGGSRSGIKVNTALVAELIAACEEVHRMTGAGTTPAALELLRWPGVVESESSTATTLEGVATELLDTAIATFLETRQREGQRIAEFIAARIDEAGQHVAALKQQLPQLVQSQRERLQQRIADLGVHVDPQRLEQEVVLLAQRLDIAEEVDRLETHLLEVRRCLAQAEPVGRRLDFLMQELNREANTLGSKSQHLESTSVAVELKVLIEQMREQVQNIE
jgi:uncharacterized protein (TIGR00255 family)